MPLKSASLKFFQLTGFKKNGHVAPQLLLNTQLNPIELILVEMKRRVANTSFKLHNVRKHTIHTLEDIS